MVDFAVWAAGKFQTHVWIIFMDLTKDSCTAKRKRPQSSLVDQILTDNDIDVDRHSNGETLLAHKSKHAQDFPALQAEIKRDYGVTAEILGKTETSPKRAWRRISWRNNNPHRLWIEPAKICKRIVAYGTKKGCQNLC